MSTARSPRSIVFAHSSDELYGADRMLLEELAAVPPGVRVEVWVPTDLPHPAHPLCDRLDALGITVRHLDLPVLRRAYLTPAGLLGLSRRTIASRSQLAAVRPDVLYCTTSAMLPLAPVARSCRMQVVAHVQEIWTPRDRRLLTPLARSSHRLLAISDAVAGSLPGRLRDRTVVVPNGTPDPGPATPLQGRDDALTFLVASRWNRWKGHATLLTAWASVPRGRLLVLGGPPPSGERTEVEKLVAALPDPSSVEVVGEVADPAPYLDRADVVVVPSDEPEPFGLVAIEAFARGRPVIASAAGGLLDIVTDGVDGWRYPLGDAPALAEVIKGLDRDQVNAAGRRARAAFEARFTSARFAHEWCRAMGLSPAD